jgi:antitoxin component YwqK of YwqJK toxin-antitoxin module
VSNEPHIRNLILVLALLWSTVVCGQNYFKDFKSFLTYNADTINRVDSGIKEGLWIDLNSEIETTQCFTTSIKPRRIRVYDINNIGEYKNGLKSGEWKEFYPANRQNVLAFRVSKLTNLKIEDIPRGELHKQVSGHQDGLIHGTVNEYVRSGWMVQQEVYDRGTLVKTSEFFENGSMKFQAQLKDEIVFQFSVYYESGEPKISGSNVNMDNFEVDSLQCFDKLGKKQICRYTKYHEILLNERLIAF